MAVPESPIKIVTDPAVPAPVDPIEYLHYVDQRVKIEPPSQSVLQKETPSPVQKKING